MAKVGNGITLAFNYVLGHGSPTALIHSKETSVHPDVFEAVGVIKVLKGLWNYQPGNALLPVSATQVDVAYVSMARSIQMELDALLPGAGSYYNEGDYLDPTWAERYWGSRYPSLLKAKSFYDPENVFTCWQCVGSENRTSCGRRLGSVRSDYIMVG